MKKTKRVLIDTSAWIMALRPGFSSEAAATVGELIEENLAVTLPVIILELLSGARTAKEYTELKQDLAALPVLDQGDDCCDVIYEHGFRLRRAGLNVPTVDIMVSGSALAHNCRVLHADRHFELIAKAGKLDALSLI